MTVIIKGLRSTKRALDVLPDRLERRAVRGALKAGAKPVVKAAKTNLKPHKQTGNLARSVKSRSLKRGLTGRSPVIAISASSQRFYDAFLEFGTVKIQGIAWLNRAFDSNQSRSLFIIKRQMQVRILKEVKKLQSGFIKP